MDPTHHIDELSLWRFLRRELDGVDDAAVGAHLARCDRCQVLRRELDHEGVAFRERDAHAAAETLLGQLSRRQRLRLHAVSGGSDDGFRWPAFALGGVSTMVLAVLFFSVASLQTVDPGLREKGAPSLHYVCERDGVQRWSWQMQTHRAGDELMLRLQRGAAWQRWVFVMGVEPGKAPRAYHPFDGEQSVPMEGGVLTLPHALRLDAGPGPEEIVAVFSDEPLQRDEVEAMLAQAREAGFGVGELSVGVQRPRVRATSVVLRWER